MWRNTYSPYAGGKRRSAVPDERREEEGMVDVTDIARAQGFRYPVFLSEELAATLKPSQILSGFGIRFEKRVRNVLLILKTHMSPRGNRYYDDDDPDEARAFPFVVLLGPNIEEKLISIRARVEQDEEGEPVVMLASSLREAA
jgi:hypothetical protein